MLRTRLCCVQGAVALPRACNCFRRLLCSSAVVVRRDRFPQPRRTQPSCGRLLRHALRASVVEAGLEQQQQGSSLLGDPDPEALSNFLGWLVSNGVQGLGTAASKLSLYESESGERGFLATQDIATGDELLRVPLRLALTDFAEDEESNALLYEGAPWSVRLSAKLLRELRAGPSSPRWPYLQVLPRLVPAPLETFSWEQMTEIQYAPGQAKLHEYSWLVSDSYSRCSSEALGGATEEQYQWAMSIVHSRTFGNAAKGGGVGVHMLVPLIDMFNHGGDETASGLMADPNKIPTDNVRWDVVRASDGSDGWEMVVTATQDTEAGYQLLLSYGERDSDDFFLHYGFVPEANSHESVQLFGDLTEALDWHFEQQGSQLSDAAVAEQAYRNALAEATRHQDEERRLQKGTAGQQQQQQQQWGRQGGQQGQQGQGASKEEGKPLPVLLHAGGRVDASLMLAFGRVSGFDSALQEGQVSRHCLRMLQTRCLQMLHGMPTTLLQDICVLWADAAARGDEDASARHLDTLRHYRHALQSSGFGDGAPTSDAPSAGPAAASASGSSLADGSSDGDGCGMALEAFAWQTYLSTRPGPVAEVLGAPEGEGGSGSATAQQGSAAAAALVPASPSQLLLLRYRAGKKAVLWDAALATAAALAAVAQDA